MDSQHPSEAAPAATPPHAEPTLSFFQLANVLIRNRLLVVGLPLLVGGAMAIVAYSKPRQFQAAAAFVPNGASDAGSQLSSIAAQLGISVASGQPGQSPQFYSELLTSRDIMVDAVRTQYTVPVNGRPVRGDLIHFFALDDPAAQPSGGVGHTPLDLAVKKLRSAVSPHVSLETGVVSVTVTSENPKLSEAILARLIALTQDFDLTKRRTQASARRKFAEDRVVEARTDLRGAEARLADFVSHNRQFQNSPLQMLEQNKLQQEILLKQQVYGALVQTYEQARIDEVRNTPVITVLESPQGSATPQSRGTVGRLIIGLVLGGIVAAFLALLREAARTARATRDADFEEFLALRRSLLPWPRRTRRTAGNGRPVAP